MNDPIKFFSKNKKIFFFAILFVGVFLRFYNLNWGAPFYFHPDERQNISYPIQESKSLLLRDQKNFDINPFPLIVIKNTYNLISMIPGNRALNPIETTIIISRIYSALLSIIICLFLFAIGKRVWNYFVGYIAFILGIFSTGLIQYAHFGTIELWEGLVLLLLFYLTCEALKTKKIIYFFAIGIVFAIGISTKFLVITFLPIVTAPFVPPLILLARKRRREEVIHLLRAIYFFLVGFSIIIIIFFPQLFLNFNQIENSLKFESTVATGKLKVFFTQGFTNTTPVIYQLTSVLPFLLNPFIIIISVVSLLYSSYLSIIKKDAYLLLLVLSFLIPFFGSSLLFVKWTRYMVPIIPFLYLSTAVFIYTIYNRLKEKYIRLIVVAIPIMASVLFSFSFFITVYLHNHTAVDASYWFKNTYKHASTAISESYDIGISPFHPLITQIEFVDFYSLDTESRVLESLRATLPGTEFVILPSQRILKSRIQNPKDFPQGYLFYNNLISSSGNFKLVFKTPCDVFCKITYMGDPIFSNEETFSVFDRPTVFIFRNNKTK